MVVVNQQFTVQILGKTRLEILNLPLYLN